MPSRSGNGDGNLTASARLSRSKKPAGTSQSTLTETMSGRSWAEKGYIPIVCTTVLVGRGGQSHEPMYRYYAGWRALPGDSYRCFGLSYFHGPNRVDPRRRAARNAGSRASVVLAGKLKQVEYVRPEGVTSYDQSTEQEIVRSSM